ncbi:MAG: FAD-dependent oxidoreductase [Myxococcaceae bacterium]
MVLKAIALACNVLVIGGGPGGLHTAYQLSKLAKSDPNSNICLIEKENHLGGRLYDVALDPAHPDWLYGLGAIRVMESQGYVRALAKEIGVELEFAPYRDNLISTRGFFSFASDEINTLAYPLVTKEFMNSTGHGTEDAFYQKLRFGPERSHAQDYPDLRSYIRAVLGTQAYQFLPDVFRFRAEFEVPLDPRSYLDYLDEETETCCRPFYPVGGMSAFIRQMAKLAKEQGAQIYVSQGAKTISKQAGAYPYQVTTPDYVFSAKRLVIATDARSFNYIGGDIASRIQAKPQFQDIFGIKIVTISQRWPSAWWHNSGYPGKDVHRAWTTEHCLNFIEIPINPYAAQQNVTRSVYDDDVRCTRFWENTYQRLGLKAVEEEINRGLHYLFPLADIPKPLHTVVQIWPAGWYYLKAGTKFTNKQVAEWAKAPLVGEDISLVGDSYYIQRSGWSDGAYKSSINTLNTNYGFNISIPAPVPPT